MKPLGMRLLGLGLLVSSLVGGTMSANAQPAVDGLWTTNFTWGGGGGVEAVHTFLLPTGKVMFWSTWRESVGLWDPVTSQFSTAGNLPAFNPFCSGHAWLPDGRLLVAGGHIFNYDGENRADIYNPFTNRWANADPLQANVPNMGSTSSDPATSGKRWYPSATTLSNGDVLVLSGDVVPINNGGGNTNRTAQIYQPATNTWRTLTGALRPANDLLPEYPRVFQGPDGRAISMSDNSNDTEYLDLAGNGSWSYLQDTLDSNLHNYGPAVMYDTGKIAYIGGGNTPTRNISILDLNATQPAWRYGGGGTTKPPFGSPYVMNRPRRQNNATILADGTVLITGGTDVTGWNDPNGLIATAEIWDPVTEEVTQVASANTNIYRGYHSTALLLPDGRVLVTGGDHDYGGVIPGQNTNAEVFSPAYLFNDDGTPAARPTVTAAPDVAELGDTIFVETPDAASIAKALWVVPGAVTHAQNWTQRANTLDFSISDGGVNIQLPANQNEAPVGYYMLFLVNDQGTPSIAEWIRATPNIQLDGDFNHDDVVDAADYTVWRDNLDGQYTEADYELWKNNFGMSAGAAAVAESSHAVPEASGIALFAAALVHLGCVRRSRR
ncbi:MAG: galactose oxidase-like domain-containing protein [Pirellulales bacterium]